MEGGEPLRLLLDSDLSSHGLTNVLKEHGHDVLAAGLDDSLQQLDDRILFGIAQEERRVMITHNSHDFPDILREWAEAERSHHGCITPISDERVRRDVTPLRGLVSAVPRSGRLDRPRSKSLVGLEAVGHT
jgi:hypothetical protein